MSTERRSRSVAWFGHVLGRPALVAGGALLLLVAGAVTFSGLRRDLFPDLALPSVQILLQSPGRSAAELELAVAQPAEQALQGLPDVRRIATTLQPGVVQIVVAFENGVDPFRSRMLVGERLASVSGAFPKGTSAPILTSAAGRLLEIQELVLEG